MIRWYVKANGERVLQEYVEGAPGDWVDVPTVEKYVEKYEPDLFELKLRKNRPGMCARSYQMTSEQKEHWRYTFAGQFCVALTDKYFPQTPVEDAIHMADALLAALEASGVKDEPLIPAGSYMVRESDIRKYPCKTPEMWFTHHDPENMLYTSMPPQRKCKRCGSFYAS